MSNVSAQPSASAPVPEIPGYRLGAVLGRGATGTVYRAIQLAVDREVAVKVLHPELAGSKAVRRLQREARTTARLAHPGIVSAIDMGQVGGLWWYAMELVDGPSLSALLREKGRLSEREALRLFIPLCEALEHAHEQGVVHRDIKPANILVDAHGRARLVDLGLAFTEDDPLLTRTGGTLGTPHYLSPEQARNPQAVDGRSDIWSMGASMFHALCGRPPFAGESVAEILSGVLYAHIPDPRELEPSLSPGMGLVLRKCLTRNTDKRYGKPSELLHDLEALRERRAVHVSVRNLDPVAGEAERRRRHAWIGGGVALAVACAGLIWWRPWAAPGSANQAHETVRASWAPLDAVLGAAAANDRRAPGQALVALDEMRDGIPPEYSNDYWAARASVQSRFDERVKEEKKRIVQEYERALTQERDFVRAAAIVAPEVEMHLARELGANSDQRELIRARLDFRDLREQADKGEGDALNGFLEQVNSHYEAVILPKARDSMASGAWRDALALMQRDVREILESARISARGLAPSKVQDHIDNVRRLKVDSMKHAIERAWVAKDVELERAVIARQRAIEGELRGRTLDGDAAAAIEAAYAEELELRGLRPDQMLSEVADRSHEALSSARESLIGLQAELLITDARAELASVDAQHAEAWRNRQYSEIAAAWSKRLDEEWLAGVRSEIELRVGEARLLEGLLERAVRGLAAPGLNKILVGTIERTGRIEVGADPLRDGFQFWIGGKSEAFALRQPLDPQARFQVLGPDSIELLAGLARDPKDESNGVDRLVRALFRLREADPDAALRAFHSGPLPIESHAALALDLEARLNRARGELSARLQEREDAAQSAYNLIQRERTHTRDEQARIRRITDLLTQYGDTAFVREHEQELREVRDQLLTSGKLTPEARLKAIYGSAIRFPSASRARIEFNCAREEIPRWDMGDWKRAVDGWSADRQHSRKELEDETLWPRLLLEEPLDLDAAMSVEIEFDQPQSSGPPQRFIASVAGWHIGFAAPTEVGGKSQVATAAGGAYELRDLLKALDNRKGDPSAGPERGKHYVLRMELEQSRGKMAAWLNGESIKVQDQIRPEGRGGSYSVVVRSLEPVLLKAVRIEAGVGKK